ncbi:MAG: hypothetical protein ACLUCI_03210 [Blautia hansenii]
MKKRAKQLAMLGLIATMTCGIQVTTFAATENEVEVETNKEAEEENTHDVIEEKTPAEENAETDASETPSTETKPEIPETNTKPETSEPEDQTPAAPVFTIPKIKVDVNTTVFDCTQDIVVTYTVTNWDELTNKAGIVASVYAETFNRFSYNGSLFNVYASEEGDLPENVFKFVYTVDTQKQLVEELKKAGMKDGEKLGFQTSIILEQFDEDNCDYRMDTKFEDQTDVSFIYKEVTKPEQPEQPEQKPDGNTDGNAETPERPEQKPDDNNSDTQKPNEQKPNEQKPNEQKPDEQKPDEQKPDEQKPTTGKPVKETKKPAESSVKSAPKTSDTSAVLPLLTTGLSSMGVALGVMFKRRK